VAIRFYWQSIRGEIVNTNPTLFLCDRKHSHQRLANRRFPAPLPPMSAVNVGSMSMRVGCGPKQRKFVSTTDSTCIEQAPKTQNV
jgi:hypothetical protein